MSERGADWGQVRLILSAHRTASRRQRLSDGGARVLRTARDVLFAAVVPISSVGVGQSLRGLAGQGAELPAAGLHLAYFLTFAVLTFGPVLGIDRGLPDAARVAGLPVSPRTAFAATVAGRLLSVTTLCVMLAAACVIVGYGGGAGPVAGRLVLLALLSACGVTLGQVLLLAFARVLSARRWRFLGALLPVAGVLVLLLGLRSGAATSLESVVRDFAVWRDWTVASPSWWAAAAATARAPLDLAPAAGLPVLVWWLLAAGGLLERNAPDVSARPLVTGSLRPGVGGSSRPGMGGRDGPLERWLPGPLAATLEKDLRLLGREPALRAVLAPQAAFALLPAALVLWAAAAAAGGDAAAVEEVRRVYPLLPALGYTLVFLEAAVLLNLLGLEGRGVAHWLSLPEPHGTLLVGKDLALLLTLGPVNAGLVAVTVLAAGLSVGHGAAAVLGDAALASLEALCVLAAALAVGDVVSIVRPVPLAGRGRGVEAVRSAGCPGGGGLLFGALGAIACLGAALPVALLFHHPVLLETDGAAWLALTVPLAVLGSAGLVLLGARAGGALLAAREETVRSRML